MMSFRIGKKNVGEGYPTFIVAEVSCNHKQNFNKAVQIIKAAAKAGADAVKFQTFTPDTMTLDSNQKWFRVDGGSRKNPKEWSKETFYSLYQKAYTPWDWQPKLQKIAQKEGLIFFSTPFDPSAVDYLETLNVPCYKVAAYEALDIPLLRKVARTKKPVIVSVGFATLDEIKLIHQTLKKNGAKNISFLHCLTSYSKTAKGESTNLKNMIDLKGRFNVVAGFSDNMGGIDAPALAAAMGASIIEKHLVLKHSDKTFDDRFSLDPREFKAMVDKIRAQEKMMGGVQYGPQTTEEKGNMRFRRSLFVSKDMKKGEKFSTKNIRSVRPGYGLAPKYFEKILGKKAAKNISFGTPLNWKLIK